MINSLYYTFSTLAQTLAGAIALLGAFVLFRMQSLNKEIEENAQRIAIALQTVLGEAEVKKLYKYEYRALLDRAAHVFFEGTTKLATLEQERLSLLLDRKDLLVQKFKIAFYLTIGLIMVSVIMLTLSQILVSYAWLVYLSFTIGLLGLSGCLISYVRLMLESLK